MSSPSDSEKRPRVIDNEEQSSLKSFIIYSIIMFISSFATYFISKSFFLKKFDKDTSIKYAAFCTIGIVNLFLIAYIIYALFIDKDKEQEKESNSKQKKVKKQ